MAKSLKVMGVSETTQAFDKLQKDIGDLSTVHKQVMQNRLPGVSTLTPVRTGILRGSWGALGSPESGSILSPVSYAAPVEYGVPSRSMAGVGMVQRTLEAESAKMVKEYEKAVLDLGRKRGFRVA